MAEINILIAVDGATLAQQVKDGSLNAGTKDNPTILGAYSSSDAYISMIAPNSSVSNGTQGDSELQISANSQDTLTWAITTFNNNSDQTAYLYAGTFNPSSAIGSLTFNSGESYAYLAQGNPPANAPTKYVNQVSTVSTRILEVGVQIQYYLSFALVDNSMGNIIGYFAWDPFINVN